MWSINEEQVKDFKECLFSFIETFIFSLLLVIFFTFLVNEGSNKWLLVINFSH